MGLDTQEFHDMPGFFPGGKTRQKGPSENPLNKGGGGNQLLLAKKWSTNPNPKNRHFKKNLIHDGKFEKTGGTERKF